MSSTVDVGDAVELTFTTAPGADVTVMVFDQNMVPDGDPATLAEDIPGSGRFVFSFVPSSSGIWTVQFTSAGTATNVERFYLRAISVTGPPPLATVGDVVEQYGTMSPAKESLTNTLLRAASSLVRSRFPTIDAQITAGLVDGSVVALGVTNMVLRVLRNPGGLKAETSGPFSRTYDTSAAAGLIVLTDSDASMFTPGSAASGAAQSIGSFRVSGGFIPPVRPSYPLPYRM
jgi:hypothetical protein